MKVVLIVVIVLLIVFIIWQTYEQKQFDVTHYYINTPKVTKAHRICVVSDLHQHNYGHYNDILIDAIKAQEPDMILVPGDMIVDKKPYQYGVSSSFMAKISQIAPVYFSNGNHEKRVENKANPNHVHYELYKESLSNFNIYTLNNTGTQFDKEIEIYGLDLPTTYYTKGKSHKLSVFELMHMLGREPVAKTESRQSGNDRSVAESFFGEDKKSVAVDSEDKTGINNVSDTEDKAVEKAEALEAEMRAKAANAKLDKMLNSNSQMAALYSDLMRSKHETTARRPKRGRKDNKHRSLLASMVYSESDRFEQERKEFDLESMDMRPVRKAPEKSNTEVSNAFSDDAKYRILLAHSPEFGNTYAEAGFDLSFCGHYHGGLVCLPNGRAVISPSFKLFPEFASGDNVVKGRHIITSRGLGTHTFNIRVFDRAELPVIHLLPEGANDAFKYKDPFDDIDFTAL